MELLDRMFAAAYARLAPRADAAGLGAIRRELLSRAEGVVVEIGAGTGTNLAYLQHPGIDRLTRLEPSKPMALHLRRALGDVERDAERDAEPGGSIEALEAPAEALPFPDASVDTVVSTLVLCTVPDQARSLSEVHRILRPGGQLILLEHVVGDGALRLTQRAIEPVWKVVGRGCHLTRDTRSTLEQVGFDTTDVRPWRLPGGGPAAPAIIGTARRPARRP